MSPRTCLLMLFLSSLSIQTNAGEIQQLIGDSQKIISEFSGELRAALQEAMQGGGPVKAIEICKTSAPQIANSLSREGWQVRRTSLKVRNPANSPDSFELNVLTDFERRKNHETDIKNITYFRMTEVGERVEFRYMKAIPTDDLCLTCHGNNIEKSVSDKIEQLYPEDRARGFVKGDLRGAFSLRKIVTPE